MGFSEGLAAEALRVSAGDLLRATDWILSTASNHSSCKGGANPISGTISTQPLPPSSSSSSSSPQNASSNSNFQPKINRFFHFPPPKTPDDRHLLGSTTNDNIAISGDGDASGKIPFQPLSERMRPQTLDQVVGQDHILGPNFALRSGIRCGRLPSLLLWGPPGTEKTSIARAIVASFPSDDASAYQLVQLSAVNAGVKDVRDAVDEGRRLWKKSSSASETTTTTKKRARTMMMRTVVFIDEVHRFNKVQQDSPLPVIEDGSIVFVGATTENPSFHLITPLLSRSTLLVLNPLQPDHIVTLLDRAVSDPNKGLQLGFTREIRIEDQAIEFLAGHCDGDARVALNALEISANTAVYRLQESDSDLCVSLSDVKAALQSKHVAYDRAGDAHYNLISALHKSMRGSDPDASIYWLARMLEGGEQPLYIARRLIRFASEDVGLADPSALVHDVACYQACHFIGMPECNVNLAQCVSYLALAPESVSVYNAIEDAQKVVRESVGQNEGVPLHLRNAPTNLMKDLGYGKGYLYPPDHHPDSLSQTYMPPSSHGRKFLHWPNAAPGSD